MYNSNIQKNILQYTVIFEKDKDGIYNISVPILPGCYTFGATFEKAEKKAKEVIELWVEELAEQGTEIPRETTRPVIAEVQINTPEKFTKNKINQVYATI